MKNIMKENYMFDTENITSVSKNMIVVCYDISDNSIRSWCVLQRMMTIFGFIKSMVLEM